MTTSKPCSIKLLNRAFDIKCPEHEAANLLLAAEKLNEQLMLNKKNFKQIDDFQNMVLAALHVSHELILCQQQQEKQRHQVTEFINSLESRINSVVKSNSRSTKGKSNSVEEEA